MSDKKPAQTYGELTRSTEPWPWKQIARNLSFTPDELAARLAQIIEDAKKKET